MRLSNIPRRAMLGAVMAAALAATAGLPAYANPPTHAASYLNGGIGASEQEHMRHVAKDWPLHMVFSEHKNNEFVANVTLQVSDAQGKQRLQISDAGPITYARLPPGKYLVTASYKGQAEKREVTLDSKAPHDLHFHWSDGPKVGAVEHKLQSAKPMHG